MKNFSLQNKGFTLLEILVVMGIISVLLAVGASAISQFGKRQNVVSQGYLVKNKLKSFQNSAINQRLEGEAERYACGPSPVAGGGTLCDDNRWFYGVGVEIDYTNNKIVAKRIFKNASGAPDVARLQWKEPAKFPTQSFTTAYLVGNNSSTPEFIIDPYPISEAELLDEVKLYDGAGNEYIPGSGEVQIHGRSRCDYVVFLAVTGKPVAFNGEEPNKNTNDIVGGIDQCIIYMLHEDNPKMVRGLILRRDQTTIEQCLSPLDCGNKLGVYGPN